MELVAAAIVVFRFGLSDFSSVIRCGSSPVFSNDVWEQKGGGHMYRAAYLWALIEGEKNSLVLNAGRYDGSTCEQ